MRGGGEGRKVWEKDMERGGRCGKKDGGRG